MYFHNGTYWLLLCYIDESLAHCPEGQKIDTMPPEMLWGQRFFRHVVPFVTADDVMAQDQLWLNQHSQSAVKGMTFVSLLELVLKEIDRI